MYEEQFVTSTPTTLRDTVNVVKRRKWLMLGILGIFLAIAALIVLITEPSYRSVSMVLVQGRTAGPVAINQFDPLNQLAPPETELDLQTHVQILQSWDVLSRAFSQVGVRLPPPGSDEPAPQVTVEQVLATNVLQVAVDAKDQKVAQELAQTIPVVYRQYLRESRRQKLEQLQGFLESKILEEKKALANAEAALEKFRDGRDFVAANIQAEASTGRLTQAQLNYQQANAAYEAAKDRVASLQSDLAKLPATIEYPNEASAASRIEDQKVRIRQLRAQRDALLANLLPTAPQVRELNAQIAREEENLKALPKTLPLGSRQKNPLVIAVEEKVADAQAQLRAAEANRAEMLGYYNAAKADLAQFNSLTPRYNELSREVEMRSTSLGKLLNSREELALRTSAVRDPVQTITQATVPLKTKPNLILIFTVMTLLGLVAAIGGAMVSEHFEDRIITESQVGPLVGLPTVGNVPVLGARSYALAKSDARSAAGIERYRILLYNLVYANQDHPFKSILVTSPGRREGKTELASNLAVAVATDGRKAILVDANLRRPTINQRFNQPVSPGLTDVVHGQVSLEEALRPTDIPGLMVLSAGSQVSNPLEVLGSDAMRNLVAKLQDSADFVLYSGAPVLVGADSQVLSTLTDSTVVAARVSVTRKGALQTATNVLRNAHARLLGVVFSNTAGEFTTAPIGDLQESPA